MDQLAGGQLIYSLHPDLFDRLNTLGCQKLTWLNRLDQERLSIIQQALYPWRRVGVEITNQLGDVA